MDSEHRHELEENLLAKKLVEAYEDAKPRLPSYGLALALVVVAVLGVNAYRSSASSANAERWRDFSRAIETGSPNQELLQDAAAKHAGTPVGEWAEITWADSRLFQAAGVFFRNRIESNKAVEEAITAYERLVSAKDRDVAERAGFQLGRAYELRGDLEAAIEQYGRVTGPFAEVAAARAEKLGEEEVQQSYSWISATKTAPEATPAGDAEPDDLQLPEENADETLGSLLDEVGTDSESIADEAPAEEEAIEEEAIEEEAVEETADAAAEETAESSTEAVE